MGRKIYWEQLILQGFGCYKHPVEVTFKPGLNNLVAANEQGKSTLVTGLVAVLFGLPNSTDPTKFGKAKYRNWEGVEPFNGEVRFWVDRKLYRIQRDFSRDRVSLQKRSEKSWVQLAGGEHRAQARRPNLAYLEKLAELISIATPELFWSTFCVGQPLPEPEKINQKVQQLLSGAGTSATQALEKIKTWLEKKTRYTGRLRVTTRDKHKDRELEICLEKQRQLEKEVRASIANVDTRQVLQAEITVREAAKRKLEADIADKQKLYEAWSKWRHLRDRYADAVQEQWRLNQAQQEAGKLNAQLEQSAEEIKRDYAEFLTAPLGLEDRLEELLRLEIEIERRQKEIQKDEAERHGLDRVLVDLEQRLQGTLAPAVGRPHLAKDHQELRKVRQELKELEFNLAELDRQEAEARQILTTLSAWSTLGDKPLSFYQQAARTALQSYRELKSLLEQQEARQREITTTYRVFEEADAQLLMVCRDYPVLKGKLEQQRAAADATWEQEMSRLSEWQGERENLEQEFADLSGISEVERDAINAKLELEPEKSAMEDRARMEAAKGWKKARIITSLIFILAAGISWSLDLPLIVSWILGGAGATLGIYSVVMLKKARSLYQLEVTRLNAKLTEVNAKLGRLATYPVHELGAVRERLKVYQERKQKLMEKAKDIPSEMQINDLKDKAEQAERKLMHFNRQLEPVLQVWEEPSMAYREWQRSKDNLADLKERTIALAQNRFGVGLGQVETLPLDRAEGWKEVTLLARATTPISEFSGTNLQAAALWLEALNDKQWRIWEAEIVRYQKAKEELRICALKRDGLEKTGVNGITQSQRLAEAISRLQVAIHPLTEDTPLEIVEQLVDEYQQAKRDWELKKAAVDKLKEKLVEQNKELGLLEKRQTELRRLLASILTPAQGGALEAKSRWQEWHQKENQRHELRASLEGLLRGWKVKELKELALKGIKANNAAQQLRKDWQALVDLHPGLPGLEMADLREALEAEYLALEQSLADLKQQNQSLDEEIFKQNKKLHALMGEKVVNIAATKEQIIALDQEIARGQLETEALALAYRELAAARDYFSTTYRERLATAASGYFVALTQAIGRQVTLDNEFKVGVVEADGPSVEIAQLSQGAQDQLQISLRLAIADLVAEDCQLPLIFDDPFLNFDSERLAELHRTLIDLGKQRQVLILSHQETYRTWGSTLQVLPYLRGRTVVEDL